MGPKVFLVILGESKIFSSEYFVGANYFLVGTLWVQKFFSWILLSSEIFSRGYFVGIVRP